MGVQINMGANDDACVSPWLEEMEVSVGLVSTDGEGTQGRGSESLGAPFGKRSCTSPARLPSVCTQLDGTATPQVLAQGLLRDERRHSWTSTSSRAEGRKVRGCLHVPVPKAEDEFRGRSNPG